MGDAARVLTVDALDDLRLAFIEFGDEAQTALDTADGVIRRTQQWLEQRLQLWRAEVRSCEEEVFIAKQTLARKKMRESHDRHVDCTDEVKAVRNAKNNLYYAEDKVEITRKWLRQFSQELIEYEGPARVLKSILEADLPQACAMLENKKEVLDEYMQVLAPSASAIGNNSATEMPRDGGAS